MSLHNIIINGNSFRSVEHYFQSRKHLPHNKPHALSITLAPDAFFAKTLGGQRTALGICPKWESIKVHTMNTAIRAKFSQHQHLHTLLISTADATLIEATNDSFWGRGKDGHGQNKMGLILMEIRATLLSSGNGPHGNSSPPYSGQSPPPTKTTPSIYLGKRTRLEPQTTQQITINIHHQGSFRHRDVAQFSCGPLAISLAALLTPHDNNDFTLPTSSPLITNLLSQARLTTSHLVLPNSGSFILEHLLAAPELHLAGAWNSGPPPLILNPKIPQAAYQQQNYSSSHIALQMLLAATPCSYADHKGTI